MKNLIFLSDDENVLTTGWVVIASLSVDQTTNPRNTRKSTTIQRFRCLEFDSTLEVAVNHFDIDLYSGW